MAVICRGMKSTDKSLNIMLLSTQVEARQGIYCSTNFSNIKDIILRHVIS